MEIGAIDHKASSWAEAVREADLVVLCTPVGIFEQAIAEIAPLLRKRERL